VNLLLKSPISDLRVDYDEFVAVDDLTLTIPRGEVMGWVGPNGAGKTSAFRVLTMLMEPTYGEVKLGGLDISLRARRVSFHFAGTPKDQAGLIQELTGQGFELRTVSEEQFSLEEVLERAAEEGGSESRL
jgi:ABC-2 type transport system ATP-binding protein